MNNGELDQLVVAISGAGGGIGRAIALDVATRGAKVVVNDYGTDLSGRKGGDAGPAERVAEEIRSAGGQACAVIADVGIEAGAGEVINAAIGQFGRIDGLVHSACIFPPQGAFEDMLRADFERVIRVNVHGAWGLTQAAWPHFKAQRHGRVVLIQSAAGFYGRSGMQAYGMAKSSFIGFTNYLMQEGAPHGILVNNVSPVGWSRAPASEGDSLKFMQQMFPAADLGPVVSMLLDPTFDRSGLFLHTGGGMVTSMFLPETRGVIFPREALTPAAIRARLDDILDEREYRRPKSVDDVGRQLYEAVAKRDGIEP